MWEEASIQLPIYTGIEVRLPYMHLLLRQPPDKRNTKALKKQSVLPRVGRHIVRKIYLYAGHRTVLTYTFSTSCLPYSCLAP